MSEESYQVWCVWVWFWRLNNKKALLCHGGEYRMVWVCLGNHSYRWEEGIRASQSSVSSDCQGQPPFLGINRGRCWSNICSVCMLNRNQWIQTSLLLHHIMRSLNPIHKCHCLKIQFDSLPRSLFSSGLLIKILYLLLSVPCFNFHIHFFICDRLTIKMTGN